MSLIGVVIVLVIVGVILYCVNTMIPMDARIKQILGIVVLLVVLLWLLQVFGVTTGSIRIP